MAQIDLFGFGIAAVDDFLELAAYPEAGSKAPVLARRRQGGGLCATALVAAARLGLRCRYGGILGDNALSQFTREVLEAEGIAVASPPRHPDAEPFHSTILVDRSNGERTILFARDRVTPPTPEDIDESAVRASKAIFVDHLGPEGQLHACRIAKQAGVPIIADIERADTEAVREIMRVTNHLILPKHFAVDLTGVERVEDIVLRLAADGRRCTAVTDGIRGCWYVDDAAPGRVQHQPAFRVDTVDTTGCGDTFHGAYAAGVVWGASVTASIRFAAAAAAIKSTRPGGQAGIPDRNTVEAFLAKQGGSGNEL